MRRRKNIMKKIAIISTIVLGLATTSCDDYLDINQDPNSPAESNMTTSIMLPAAEMNLAGSYGDFLRITGGYYAQHYAQTFGTSNYLDYSQFKMSATRSSSTYTQLNSRVLKNLQTIRSMAEQSEEWGTYLAATTLRAFTYQTLVDCYGELPYSEAFDVSNTSPKYDDGADIYAGILAELDEALKKAQPSDLVATNFLYQGENAANWIKFANALKLKIMMREIDVKGDVSSAVGALIAENNFPADDVAYAGCWGSEAGSLQLGVLIRLMWWPTWQSSAPCCRRMPVVMSSIQTHVCQPSSRRMARVNTQVPFLVPTSRHPILSNRHTGVARWHRMTCRSI